MLLTSEASYYGPSYMVNPLTTSYKGIEVDVVLVNCHYPVTASSFVLQYGLIVRKLDGLPDDAANKIAKKYSDMFGEGFMHDVEIWRNKAPIQNPLLCEENGPVCQLRRWFEQFCVDAADVTEEMTQRFEFEIDTTHATENWEKEVRENIARRKAEDERIASDQAAGHGSGPGSHDQMPTGV